MPSSIVGNNNNIEQMQVVYRNASSIVPLTVNEVIW